MFLYKFSKKYKFIFLYFFIYFFDNAMISKGHSQKFKTIKDIININ